MCALVGVHGRTARKAQDCSHYCNQQLHHSHITLSCHTLTHTRHSSAARVSCTSHSIHTYTQPQATDVVWKLMVCLTLFTLANFLKSVLTKLLSSHFYKTAHFKKV